ncbi:MAG: acetyl-CoA carboxylase biotin carboxyl carrier protein [Holophagaceae bacterium]
MSTPRKKPAVAKPAPKKPQATSKAAATTPLGLEDIKALIALAGREPFQEFEFEAGDMRFRIRKDGPPPVYQAPAPAPAPMMVVAPAAQPAPAAPAAPAPAVVAAEDPAIHYVTSPIVGTFYRSSNPTAPPYVSSGDFVRPGQTLCIIEAMKLMNEIESDVAGEVIKVLVENGTPVEYGERLYAVRIG